MICSKKCSLPFSTFYLNAYTPNPTSHPNLQDLTEQKDLQAYQKFLLLKQIPLTADHVTDNE